MRWSIALSATLLLICFGCGGGGDGGPPPLEITTTSLPDATLGVPYDASIEATGGEPPYSFSEAGAALADYGLQMSGDGTLSGTPLKTGVCQFVARVEDSGAPVRSDQVALSIHVGAGNPAAPPAAPSGLTAVAVSATRIDLSWQDNSSDEDGFTIQFDGDGTFTSPGVITLGPNGSSSVDYSHTGLTPGTEYYYRVCASNSAGDSAWSNVVSATTPSAGGGRTAVLWGGADTDSAADAVVDSSGNVYVCGMTDSFGQGNSDVLVLKFDDAGALVWARVWGTALDESGAAIALDSSDNVYVAGSIDQGSGATDVLLLSFTGDGAFRWARAWDGGASGNDYATGVALDSSDNVWVAGTVTVGDISFGTYSYPDLDMALLCFQTDGTLTSAWTYGGSVVFLNTSEGANSLALDGSGNPLLAGWHASFDLSGAVYVNACVVKASASTGALLWAREVAVTGMQGAALDVACGPSGDVYVCGVEASDLTNPTADASATLCKYNSSGSLQFARVWTESSTSVESFASVAVSSAGSDVYVVGTIGDGSASGELLLVRWTDAGSALAAQKWSVAGVVVGGAAVALYGDSPICVGNSGSVGGAWSNVFGDAAASGTASSFTLLLTSRATTTTTPAGQVETPTAAAGGGTDVLIIR